MTMHAPTRGDDAFVLTAATVRHDGLGTRVTDASGGHVGFGRAVGPSRRRAGASERGQSQRGVGHKKKKIVRYSKERERERERE